MNRLVMCEVTVRITASDLRLPRWQSRRSFFTPSSSTMEKSSFVCLKSRVSWPAYEQAALPHQSTFCDMQLGWGMPKRMKSTES